MIRIKNFRLACLFSVILLLGACAETEFLAHLVKQGLPGEGGKSAGLYKVGTPYKIFGKTYYPEEDFNKVETGVASWYGPNFDGKPTANGEIFDQYALTAAHRTLQLPSIVRVTNLDNGRTLILRVNDRGPYSRGRILDVSKRGADLLGFQRAGTAKIRLEVLEEESRYAATLAKSGKSTDGLALAFNKGKTVSDLRSPVDQDHQQNTQIASADPISLQTSQPPLPTALPDQPTQSTKSAKIFEVKAEPIPSQSEPDITIASADLYIQAGAFSNYGYAQRLQSSLQPLGPSQIHESSLNGTPLYKVRIGPIASDAQADTLLQALANQGNHDAIIVGK